VYIVCNIYSSSCSKTGCNWFLTQVRKVIEKKEKGKLLWATCLLFFVFITFITFLAWCLVSPKWWYLSMLVDYLNIFVRTCMYLYGNYVLGMAHSQVVTRLKSIPNFPPSWKNRKSSYKWGCVLLMKEEGKASLDTTNSSLREWRCMKNDQL
jgi:hypothetical protein